MTVGSSLRWAVLLSGLQGLRFFAQLLRQSTITLACVALRSMSSFQSLKSRFFIRHQHRLSNYKFGRFQVAHRYVTPVSVLTRASRVATKVRNTSCTGTSVSMSACK